MNVDQLATPAYRDLLKQQYTQRGWGGSGYHHVSRMYLFALELGAKSILDYGCGRGTFKKDYTAKFPGSDVREYDPGIEGKDQLPEPADLVVCTDVMEHIEPELVGNVLRHIRKLTRKGAYLIISTGQAKQVLPDGRNAHLTREPWDWWKARLERAGLKPSEHLEKKGHQVWIRV